jgi:outer membrane protein TolC
VRLAQVRYEGGGALKSDLLSLGVRLAQAQEDLVRARNNHLLALAALANLLGADPDSQLILIAGDDVKAQVPAVYAQGVLLALDQRPELKKVRQQVVSARLALAAAQAEYLPRLDAQATYYWDDPQAQYEGSRTNYTYGLLLNWDIFTGLSTVKENEKARAALREMLAADRKATQNIQLDVKSAYLGMAESLARLEVSQAAVEQAEEALKLVGRQYEGGAADVTRYLDAELNLNAAKVRAAAASYDTLKSRADAARALGQWTQLAAKESDSHE